MTDDQKETLADVLYNIHELLERVGKELEINNDYERILGQIKSDIGHLVAAE